MERERKEKLQYFHLEQKNQHRQHLEKFKKVKQYTAKKTRLNQLEKYAKNRKYKRTEYVKPSSEAMLCMQGRRS